MPDETEKPRFNLFVEAIPPAQTAKPKPVRITLNKTLNAPLNKVIDHWLIPLLLGNWMFAATFRNETIIQLENEVKPGGSIRYHISRDGNQICYEGRFTRLRLPDELAFEWTSNKGEPDVTTVRFEEVNGKSKIKLACLIAHDSDETPESAKQRWSQRLATLADRLT